MMVVGLGKVLCVNKPIPQEGLSEIGYCGEKFNPLSHFSFLVNF